MSKRTVFILAYLFLLAGITACAQDQSSEIKSLQIGQETINAGTQFEIKPVNYKPVNISGKNFSIQNFSFNCSQLSGNSIEYKGVVAIQSEHREKHTAGSTVLTTGEKQSAQEFDKWLPGSASRNIIIKFLVVPSSASYSGEGYLYFFLVNKDNTCISNIVRWPARFS